MRYGLLSATKREKSGYGLQLTEIQGELQEHVLEGEIKKAHSAFGIPCLCQAGNMRYFILISGRHIKKFFRKAYIFPSGKKAERQVNLMCNS